MSNTRPFHEPVPIRIGEQSRTLMLTPEAWRIAQRALKQDPRDALIAGGMDPICIVGCCALRHEMKKVSDKTVEGWITHEPEVYPDLIDAVSECARRFLVRTGVLEETAAAPRTGEGEASTTTAPSTSSAP